MVRQLYVRYYQLPLRPSAPFFSLGAQSHAMANFYTALQWNFTFMRRGRERESEKGKLKRKERVESQARLGDI